jgi:hypothetical protein
MVQVASMSIADEINKLSKLKARNHNSYRIRRNEK